MSVFVAFVALVLNSGRRHRKEPLDAPAHRLLRLAEFAVDASGRGAPAFPGGTGFAGRSTARPSVGGVTLGQILYRVGFPADGPASID